MVRVKSGDKIQNIIMTIHFFHIIIVTILIQMHIMTKQVQDKTEMLTFINGKKY